MIRTYRDLGRYADALECYEEALPMARRKRSHWLEANILRDMGLVYRDRGNPIEALACLERALPLFREVDDKLLATYTVRDIGMVYQQQGDQAGSEPRFRESLAAFEELGDQRGAARTLNSLGISYREQHRWDIAMLCLGQSLEISEKLATFDGKLIRSVVSERFTTNKRSREAGVSLSGELSESRL